VADGHECRALAPRPRLPGEQAHIGFSPDGHLLGAARVPDGVSLWDWRVGQEVGFVPLDHANNIVLTSAALFSVSESRGPLRWALTRTRTGGREHWRFGPPQSVPAGGRPGHLDVSADGTLILVSLRDQDAAAVIDLARGGPPRRLESHLGANFVSL